jgi:hypothetical protein
MRLILLLFLSFNLFAYISNVDKQSILVVNDFTANGGFENGKAKWTNTGSGTFTVQSTTTADTFSASWDAAADGDTLESDAFTIPDKLKGNNAIFCFMQKGGDANLDFIVSTTDAVPTKSDIASVTLAPETDWKLVCLNAPISTDAVSVQFRIEADADAAVIYADNFSMALASLVNISNISPASFYGSVEIAVSVSPLHIVEVTSSSWTKISDTDVDASDKTHLENGIITSNANDFGVGFSNLNSNYTYKVDVTGNFLSQLGTDTTTCLFGISADGGITVKGQFEATTTSSAQYQNINGTTAEFNNVNGSTEFTIYAKRLVGDGTCSVRANILPLKISVHRYPLESQTAINPSTQMVASGVKIAADAAHRISSTAASYEVADDEDIIEADKTHFGNAVITTDASNLGFKVPYLKANTKYKVYANFKMWNSYASGSTACRWKIYDGTNDIGEYRSLTSATSEASYISGTVQYDSAQIDKEFSIYLYREAGGGTCYADLYHVPAEIGIIPLTESFQSTVLETQWKQYDLTVTGTNWTTTRAVGLPYKDINGVWRLKFNISGTVSSATDELTLTISGITFKTGLYQAVLATLGSTSKHAEGFTTSGTSTYTIRVSATMSSFFMYGDVELDSKPTWATSVWH